MKDKGGDRLEGLIDATARAALSAGVEISDACGGPLHLWLAANVRYRPETEFFVVFLVACRMADLDAQREGYEGFVHRAFERAKASLERKRAATAVGASAHSTSSR